MKSSLLPLVLFSLASCKDDKPKSDNPPPPPPPTVSSAARSAACANGGGELSDPVSAAFLPKSPAGYCVDPKGEVRTFGENAKLKVADICGTEFDGECEVYKRFGIKRLVTLYYVDGSGKGGTVKASVSQYADVPGAYGMYSQRVVAADPAEPTTPRPLAAGGAGAIGTGRAYVYRGTHLVELDYLNDNESPEQLAKSSEAVLTTFGKEIGEKLPGPTTLPPAAALLPAASRLPNGIVMYPKDLAGWKDVGPAAFGFYKEGDRRWRVLAIVKDDAERAKEAFKTLKAKPGTLPIANTGDEAAHVVIPPFADDKTESVKPEMFLARKGNVIWGVADEEYALRGVQGAERDKVRLTKDEAIARMQPLLATAAPSVASASASASGSGAPAPKPSASASASAAPKK